MENFIFCAVHESLILSLILSLSPFHWRLLWWDQEMETKLLMSSKITYVEISTYGVVAYNQFLV